MLNLFLIVEISSEELKMTSHQVESTARETVMSREDPFRYVALLVFLAKERTLSWMKKQSETFKLCPRGMILCLSLVWPVTFHRALPSFTELDHAACHSGFVLWMPWSLCQQTASSLLWSLNAALESSWTDRQASWKVLVVQEIHCQQLSGEQQSAGVLLQDDSSWPFSVKGDQG